MPVRSRTIAALVLALAALGLPAAAPAAVAPVTVDFEAGSFAGGVLDASGGSIAATADGPFAGARAGRASWGGGSANGYARTVLGVRWEAGDEVVYGAAFRLPVGFKAAMQGQVALLRWDDYADRPSAAAHGGVVIHGSDRRARLVREVLGVEAQSALAEPFDLPEGRWVTLEVRQRLGAVPQARSEVWLDGVLVASSAAANLPEGRTPRRLRAGIVAIAAGRQTAPLTLDVDDVHVGPAAWWGTGQPAAQAPPVVPAAPPAETPAPPAPAPAPEPAPPPELSPAETTRPTAPRPRSAVRRPAASRTTPKGRAAGKVVRRRAAATKPRVSGRAVRRTAPLR